MKTPPVSSRHWLSASLLLRARILRAGLLAAGAFLAAACASATPLEEQIQKRLDASPFFVGQQLKMRVIKEQEGSVSLELTEGPQNLRDLLRRGYEINGSAFAETHFDAEGVKALRSIKRTLTLLKSVEGIKEISLTGALSPSVAPAQPRSDAPDPQQAKTNSLEAQIQKEIDSSAFLAEQQLKVRLLNARQGNVCLELAEGPQILRDLLRKGYEINGSSMAETHFDADEVKALRSLKRILTLIKGMEGVKEISLTGALSAAPPSADAPNPQQAENSALEEQIQKALDASPFLAEQQLKMHVLSENNGTINLEVTEGPKKLRDLLRRGYEINGSGLSEMDLEPEIVKPLRGIKRALTGIKSMQGVKEITLTGALSGVAPAEAQADQPGPQEEPNPLLAEIQEKLDSSPFLAEQQVKMRVLSENNGLVNLEVSEGPKKLRDLLRKGNEINGDGMGEMKLKQNVIKALRGVKKTLTIIKGLKGVKEIALTGAINSVQDRAENFYDEAAQKMGPDGVQISDEVITLLQKSGELGFLHAQTDLARIYGHGLNLGPDEELALFWFQKAAEQGDPPSQLQVATRYMQGRGTDKNYKEALAWFRKAAGQDINPDTRTRSQIGLATLLATCPDEAFRDGNAALEYAKKAVADAPNGIAIDALAAAYARCGRFEEAIAQEKKWIHQLESATFMGQEAKESLLDSAKYRLQLYLEHKPYPAAE